MADASPVTSSATVPLFSSLKQLYGTEIEHTERRYSSIKRKFHDRYGTYPTFFARAPGRVNIIGEHIDYCGYAVFPMALEQDIVIAVSQNKDGKLIIANTNEKLREVTFDVADFEINGKEWYHYVLCGHKGLLEYLQLQTPCGMNFMIDGTIPQSAGLSSSSALVCCSGLATMYANKKVLPKLELAEICAKCEKYIGTEGGGMDQSISFLAEPGSAKLIEFNPIRATNVHLPDGAVFVIANCLVEMTKSQTAGTHFNARVAECRIATQVLAKLHDLEWRKIRKLGDLQKLLGKQLEQMLDIVKEKLQKKPYNREEICRILEIDDVELTKECLTSSTADLQSFKLYDRAMHVYSEANRVWKYKEICDQKKENSLQLLGDLMNESHESCSKLYECSCTELDQLTQLCRESGALGSRLTGAGWGGCTVSLVPSDKVDNFLKKVKEGYYSGRPEREAKLAESLFATQPGSGAAIYEEK